MAITYEQVLAFRALCTCNNALFGCCDNKLSIFAKYYYDCFTGVFQLDVIGEHSGKCGQTIT